MTIAEIALAMMKRKRRPCHYLEVTGEVIKLGTLRGRTPARTVNSTLLRHPRFVRVGDFPRSGLYSPASWQDSTQGLLQQQLQQLSADARRAKVKLLRA